MSESSFVTELKLVKGYKFNVISDIDYIPDLIVDETKPEGEGAGLNPTRLLSASIGHCMSSSLIYCLKKARIPIADLKTAVKTYLYRNENGRLRIEKIDLEITLEVSHQDKSRVHRCLSIFEDYCTVTQSIRQGIQVDVKIKQ